MADPDPTTAEVPDVIDLLAQLIRFDTSNHGGGRSEGERGCAEWIAGLLREAGWQPVRLHRPDAPDRLNVVVRVEGSEPTLPGILLHVHTDVVPVEADQWSVPPFEGLVRDGYVWGRGAQDMLDSVAVALHTLLVWGREGVRPRRTVVVAFVADEEDGGHYGADWLVTEHADLFEGLAIAIGEDGAVCQRLTALDGGTVHAYTINAGERGTLQLRLTARGRSGHGSRPSGDEAIARLVRVLARIVDHRWPLTMSTVVRGHYERLAAALGWPGEGRTIDLADERSLLAFVDWLGPEVSGPMRWTIRPSATPTILSAGYKVNVVPGEATASLDVRCPPGTVEMVEQTLSDLVAGEVEVEYTFRGLPVESPIEGEWWDAMCASVLAHDPDAVFIPGCMGGGTDAKAFARLGLQTYGFTPAPADPEGRVSQGYHGVDERTPVLQVRGAARMMRAFLERA